MSSIQGFGSASSSLPENLGVGSQYTTTYNSSDFTLSLKQKSELENHLKTVKQLYDEHAVKPTKQQIDSLNSYLTDLIEHPTNQDVVESLKGMIKREYTSKDEEALSNFAIFVVKMNLDAVKIGIIQQKFKNGTQLDYSDCYLVDELASLDQFAKKISEAGVKNNKYINLANTVYDTAEANAFREFRDGDVLFYDMAGAESYRASRNNVGFWGKLFTGIRDGITMSALGTNYTHVGVFYRNDEGKPCVSQIQGNYTRTRLYFGQQSYIKGKRIEPSKLTATKLSEAERQEVQKRIGFIFSRITGQNWDIKINMTQQIACVFSHTTSLPNTKLGNVTLNGKGENLLCSEFAAKGLMQSFEQFNKEQYRAGIAQKSVTLMNPFSEYEDLSTLHPERMLVAFGPHQGTTRMDSAWEDVTMLPPGQFLPLHKMLPKLPAFPDLSYPKK